MQHETVFALRYATLPAHRTLAGKTATNFRCASNGQGLRLDTWRDFRITPKHSENIRLLVGIRAVTRFMYMSWISIVKVKNYLSDISSPGNERYNAFVEFENRLLEHKSLYFSNLSFPYVKQPNIEWKLIGPFDNKGKTEVHTNAYPLRRAQAFCMKDK